MAAVVEGATRRRSRVLLVGSAANETNVRLAESWWRLGLEAQLVSGAAARICARPWDVVLGRVDVLSTLDGVEPGLFELLRLEHQGFVVLNRARALVHCHDKLATARILDDAGIAHPRTTFVRAGERPRLQPPVVVKPRFGSWGADVELCETQDALDACLERVSAKPWYRRHGALVQEYVPNVTADLRILVAAGAVVGAVQRVAPIGDWRTNTAVGATRRRVTPASGACAIALAAAAAVGTDLVGVDLLPLAGGDYTVVELNGAVEFTAEYGLEGEDVHARVAEALGLVPSGSNVAGRTLHGVDALSERSGLGTSESVVPAHAESGATADVGGS